MQQIQKHKHENELYHLNLILSHHVTSHRVISYQILSGKSVWESQARRCLMGKVKLETRLETIGFYVYPILG